VHNAREADKEKKSKRQEATNATKYRKKSTILPGDLVLVRDWTRRSKFDPIFLPSPFLVQERNEEMKNVLLKDLNSTRTLLRHLDDVKQHHCSFNEPVQDKAPYKEIPNTGDLKEAAKSFIEEEDDGEIIQHDPLPNDIPVPPDTRMDPIPQRVSTRVRKTRKRYIEMR